MAAHPKNTGQPSRAASASTAAHAVPQGMAELQEKFMKYQEAEQHLKRFQEELAVVADKEAEVINLLTQLDKIGNVPAGTDVLIPFANGIFIPAKIGSTDRLFVNTGSQVVTEKNMQDTYMLIETQLDEIIKYKDMVAQQAGIVAERVQALEQELHALMHKQDN